MRVVGIDPSLTATGIACEDQGIRVATVGSAGRKNDSFRKRWSRIQNLTQKVCGMVPDGAVVVLEAPSYGSRTGSQHDRAGLWWAIYDRLSGHRVVTVPPTVRAMYATGKGNAGKDQVLAAVVRRYPSVEVTNNNEADALVLCAMGYRWLGVPIEDSLPQTHLRSMGKLSE